MLSGGSLSPLSGLRRAIDRLLTDMPALASTTVASSRSNTYSAFENTLADVFNRLWHPWLPPEVQGPPSEYPDAAFGIGWAATWRSEWPEHPFEICFAIMPKAGESVEAAAVLADVVQRTRHKLAAITAFPTELHAALVASMQRALRDRTSLPGEVPGFCAKAELSPEERRRSLLAIERFHSKAEKLDAFLMTETGAAPPALLRTLGGDVLVRELAKLSAVQ